MAKYISSDDMSQGSVMYIMPDGTLGNLFPVIHERAWAYAPIDIKKQDVIDFDEQKGIVVSVERNCEIVFTD